MASIIQSRCCVLCDVQLGSVQLTLNSLWVQISPCWAISLPSIIQLRNGKIRLLETNNELIELKHCWDPAFHSFKLLRASSLGLTKLGHLQPPHLHVSLWNEGFFDRNKVSTSKKVLPFCGSHKSEFLRPVASFCKGLVGDLRVKQPILAFIR